MPMNEKLRMTVIIMVRGFSSKMITVEGDMLPPCSHPSVIVQPQSEQCIVKYSLT